MLLRRLTMPLCAAILTFSACERDVRTSEEDSPLVTAAQMRELMQEKVRHAHAIMDSLAIGNLTSAGEHGDALYRLSNEMAWMAHETQAYVTYSNDFRAIVRELAEHAQEKDLPQVQSDYIRMLSVCVECHSYLRRERLTRDLPGRLTRP